MKEIDHEIQIIDNDIQEMVLKGAVEIVDPFPGQILSNLFIVPKKNGSVQPVINLRCTNLFVMNILNRKLLSMFWN